MKESSVKHITEREIPIKILMNRKAAPHQALENHTEENGMIADIAFIHVKKTHSVLLAVNN
ncbi:MAG: hypothetical protein KAJ95_00235 [Gammaproteobacteria bacterium]|nr:hypothetical protein [Gammaproteobacteria bacterium]